MKTRICRLEFGVTCLADIRVLYHAWDRLWIMEGGVPGHSVLVYLMVEDRVLMEQVNLNFQAIPELLDRFLEILEKDGLKFSCKEVMPGFLIRCRVDEDRGGLTVIGANDRHDPDGGPED
jgi:hypothetical protein